MASSAQNTAPAEASQALFCAIADYLGQSKYSKLVDAINDMDKKDRIYRSFKALISDKDLNESFKKTNTYKSKGSEFKLYDLENFLDREQDWFLSSLYIAETILKEIKNKVSNKFKIGAQDIYYARGDDEVMGNISQLFDLANKGKKVPKKSKSETAKTSDVKTPVFGDINKWCPADIYFATTEAKKDIESVLNFYKQQGNPDPSFVELNTFISDQMSKGNLLPLSLKKTTHEVHLVPVNFNRSQEEKLLSEIKFTHNSNWTPLKKTDFDKLQKVKLNLKFEMDPKDKQLIKNLPTRDIKLLFIENTGEAEIKVRHDPSGSGSIKAEYKGKNAEARGGSVVSLDIFCYLLSMVDPKLGSDFKSAWTKGSLAFRKQVLTLGENPGEGDKSKKAKAIKDLYNDKRGGMSAFYVTNEALPILKQWVESESRKKIKGTNDTKVDILMRRIYEYVTSRTAHSSKFVIAK